MTVLDTPMHGKVCLVSGATRGLGQATALGLARLGAKVVIIGRNPARIEQTLTLIRTQTGNTQVEGILADLSSQSGIRQAATEFLTRHPEVDVLVNNVGGTFLKYQESPDGYEITWALNYLGHFLLTHYLLNALKSAALRRSEARIVELTSSVYRWSSPGFDRLPKGDFIPGVLAYAKSKRAVMVYTGELARRLKGKGVTINAVSPGWVQSDIAKTNGRHIELLMGTINRFVTPTDQGAKPILRAATAPELRGVSGKFFFKDKEMPDDPACLDPVEATRLWHLSEQMTGLSRAN